MVELPPIESQPDLKGARMGEQLPAEVEKRIDKLTERFNEQVEALYRWSMTTSADAEGAVAQELEKQLRHWLGELEAEIQIVLSKAEQQQRE